MGDLEGRDLTVNGDGEYTRDYVYIEEVARANMLVTRWRLVSPSQSVTSRPERRHR
jgi:dTDP-D-glucose 4,6-dehydratase